MSDAIWVLGATGRSGRGIAERLHAQGHSLVLAGRNPVRLQPLADRLGHAGIVTGSLDEQLSQLREAAPSVVVNSVGPFTQTTARVIDACSPGTHYVDIANELPAVQSALDRHDTAVESGRTVVTGAGFGVLATESLVVKMCTTWPDPTRVRVDAVPSLAVEAGVIGAALAGSILDGLPEGGRQVDGGQLVRARVAAHRRQFTTPSGDAVATAALPTGDLLAAWRASNAESVISATNMIPSGPAVRAVLPVVSALARISALRRLAIAGLAKVPMRAQERPREFSWGHCEMHWPDGTSRDAWLRMPDAQEFSTAAAVEVAHRLDAGSVRTGAFTPAALFGPDLAVDLGATFVE